MRSLVLFSLMLASVTRVRAEPQAALAPHVYAFALHVRTSDIRGAGGFGFNLGYRIGGGRWQALGEVGVGELRSRGAWLGLYGRAQLGARFLAATLSTTGNYAADFVLDAGGGAEREWLDEAIHVDRAYAFGGWGMQLRMPSRRSFEVTLRVVVSPRLEDPSALRVICRGTCTSSDEAPADLGIDLLFGLAAW